MKENEIAGVNAKFCQSLRVRKTSWYGFFAGKAIKDFKVFKQRFLINSS